MAMRNSLIGSVLFLSCIAALAFSVAGCDTSSTTTLEQNVDEIAWLPDESGMVAYIDKTYESTIDGSQTEGANLYHAGSDGSVGNSINGNDVTITWTGWAPIVFVSANGQTAITQFGSEIYNIPLGGGSITDIIQRSALLGVSPDMNYAATTTSAKGNAATILSRYDGLSTSSIGLLSPRQTIPGMLSNRVLWIGNTQYAVTIFDSIGPDTADYDHVAIYDATSGNTVMTIPNADVSFHSSAYSSGSGDLFVRNHVQGIDRIHLATGKRDSIISNDTVESMDASSDGLLIVYTSGGASRAYGSMYAVNVTNGHTSAVLATSITAPILSPKADRVACIHQIDGNNSDIQVFSVTPPN